MPKAITLPTGRLVGADLARCPKIIVCDGYKVLENPKHVNYNRVGVVKPEQVARYHEFMDNVCEMENIWVY